MITHIYKNLEAFLENITKYANIEIEEYKYIVRPKEDKQIYKIKMKAINLDSKYIFTNKESFVCIQVDLNNIKEVKRIKDIHEVMELYNYIIKINKKKTQNR